MTASYLSGTPPTDTLADELRRVLDQLGASHALGAVLATVEKHSPTPRPALARARRAGLSPREAQLLDGMSRGLTNSDIGRAIFVTEDTVKTIARRLFAKLGCHDRAHAVAIGYQRGLLGGDRS